MDAEDDFERRKVRGHRCDGLGKFLDEGFGCMPNLDKYGQIHGCDDSNPVLIEYCPWCGVKLAPLDETK